MQEMLSISTKKLRILAALHRRPISIKSTHNQRREVQYLRLAQMPITIKVRRKVRIALISNRALRNPKEAERKAEEVDQEVNRLINRRKNKAFGS